MGIGFFGGGRAVVEGGGRGWLVVSGGCVVCGLLLLRGVCSVEGACVWTGIGCVGVWVGYWVWRGLRVGEGELVTLVVGLDGCFVLSKGRVGSVRLLFGG